VLKKYLVDTAGLPEIQIKTATGDQKALDGIDIFNPHEPTRYIITVEALKEGWDCSFAYILFKAWNTGYTGNVITGHADSCASMLVRMEDLLREEIKETILRLSMTIHLNVHLTAIKDGPIVDEVLPTADMIHEDQLEFLRNGGKDI
jgi:hypothetical protein